MCDERKQINRNVEQNRSSGSKRTANNSGTKQSKRPLDWVARDIKTNPGLRQSTGNYEDRFFE